MFSSKEKVKVHYKLTISMGEVLIEKRFLANFGKNTFIVRGEGGFALWVSKI